MIANQLPLLKREVWEHRALYVTPMVVALLVSLMSITGQVTVSALGQKVDLALLAATNLGQNGRAAALGLLMTAISGLFAIATWILCVFYALDALYAERKDRSILFWRSMPCTDAETVISKLLTALIVIPLVTLAAVIVTHLVVLVCTSVWVSVRGANAWHLIWSSAPFVDNWVATAAFLFAVSLWLSPFVGWFLFVSAFTSRSPLLVAFLPIAILPMLEKSLVGSTLLAEAFFLRPVRLPLFRGLDTADFLDLQGHRLPDSVSFSLLSYVDFGRFFSSAGLWLGLLVCGLFTAAAIYLRRYRDDS
jgi:ABC-2 type transport system permease protein